MEPDTKALVEKARQGDSQALEELVASFRDRVFTLCLRMLGDFQEAEDASQEILIKVITRLAGFRGESAFSTWVFSVAVNHLRDRRRRAAQNQARSLEESAEVVEKIAAMNWSETDSEPVQAIHVAQMRRYCLLGLLQSLTTDERMAYILGELFEVPGREGAELLEISQEAFRKRLSRARKRLREFMSTYCGLVGPGAPCQCETCTGLAMRQGRGRLPALFRTPAPDTPPEEDLNRRLKELSEHGRVVFLFRSRTGSRAPGDFAAYLKKLIDSGRLETLLNPELKGVAQ